MKLLIELPKQDKLTFLSKGDMRVAKRFWSALWVNYIRNVSSTTSSVFWSEEFSNPNHFNGLLMVLGDWIVSSAVPERNWGEVSLNEKALLTRYSPDELAQYRRDNKIHTYMPQFKESDVDDVVSSQGEKRKTGLVRKGFMKASNTQYHYDTQALQKHIVMVKKEVTKGMSKIRDMFRLNTDVASYDVIAEEIVDKLAAEPELFTQGNSYCDSRGRAIKESLRSVANPIGYKAFRALIVIPESDDIPVFSQSALASVYLFIAELNGFKQGTETNKHDFGFECYKTRKLPHYCEDELHEYIWLERLYDELDLFFAHVESTGKAEGFHWSVPIELDASASMLQYYGALLGDKRLLEMTNVAGDDYLHDPWSIEGIPRKFVKKAATPKLYGSDKAVFELWDRAVEQSEGTLSYTQEQLSLMNYELNHGALGAADAFKEFIIGHVTPTEQMTVRIWNDEFKITCNRYRQVGEVTKSYTLYDTQSRALRKINHTSTKSVPDLQGFKRYFATLLVHNLDSQVADYVAGKAYDAYGFCLDIHDAFIVSPIAAVDVRTWYANQIDAIFANRKEILGNYFQTIGIGGNAQRQWEQLQRKVVPITELKCRLMALK